MSARTSALRYGKVIWDCHAKRSNMTSTSWDPTGGCGQWFAFFCHRGMYCVYIYIHMYVTMFIMHCIFSGLYSITPSIHRNSSFYWLKDKIWIKLSHTPPCLLVKSLFSCLEHAANMPESPSLCDLFCHIPHLRWSDTTFYRSHENIIYICIHLNLNIYKSFVVTV